MASIFGKLFKPKPDVPESATPATPAEPATPAPAQFEAVFVQAGTALAAHDFERANRLYEQAIALNPTNAEAYYKRGNALRMLGQREAAIASYDQAIERKPDHAHAYCNRGFVQHSLRLLAESSSSYDQAIALDPTDAIAHHNRALLMQDCCRWDEAIVSYDCAIAINPEYADAQYNRSLTALLVGDFATGWSGFEWRWEHAQRLAIGEVRDFEQPLWLGEESIAGKRLLLHSEGGLGDTINFCRYAKLAAAAGATVILEAQAPLLGLLASLEGVSQLIAKGKALPPFDCHCPLMSLPLAFGTTLETIPAAPAYLHNDAIQVAQWRQRLGEQTRPRIGLVWSGNPKNPGDLRRSIPLADWVAHLPPEFQYFCLQKDVREADREVLESSDLIFSYDDEFQDFTNTAALCECMDIVVSVDTSMAHVSGALGHKTWILLPLIPDFRWLLKRDDTPWYPSAKLYRQKAAGDWNEVLTRVATDLRREFRTG